MGLRKITKSPWIDKQRSDHFYQLAKKLGFRARSAFKLIQIDEKYNVLPLGRNFPQKILDLGAAPGAWIEVVIKQYNKLRPNHQSRINLDIIGIDLTTLKPFIEDFVHTYRLDIFSEECDKLLQENGPFDLILSDLAPKTSGDFRDVAIQESMIRKIYDFLQKGYLRSGGVLVMKIFQSDETQNLVRQFKEDFSFTLCKLMKPKASRQKSKEIYLIAK